MTTDMALRPKMMRSHDNDIQSMMDAMYRLINR